MNSLPPIPGPLAGSASLSGGGGAVVSSLTGTPDQINVSASTGAVTVSLSSTIVTPGTLQVPNVGGTKTEFQVGSGSTTTSGVYIGTVQSAYGGVWSTNLTPSTSNYGIRFNDNTTSLNAVSQLFLLINNNAKMSFSNTAGDGATLTAGTATTNVNALSVTQTWNNAGVTFTALKANITDTASNAASMLMDLQVGGTSCVSARKDGAVTLSTSATAPVLIPFSGGIGVNRKDSSTTLPLIALSLYSGAAVTVASGGKIGFSPSATDVSGGNSLPDTFLMRNAAAAFRFGNVDAAAPVAQTLSVQNVVAGTTNTAGANFTLKLSAGTGTGNGGSFIIQGAAAGSSGTAQNTFSQIFSLSATGVTTLGGSVASIQAPSISTPSAPAAGFGRLYFDAGGAGGKMRLMALFPSGVAQVVASEP